MKKVPGTVSRPPAASPGGIGEEELVVSHEAPALPKQPILPAALFRPKPQPKPATAPATRPGG